MQKSALFSGIVFLVLLLTGCGGGDVEKYDDGFYESGTYYFFGGGTGQGRLVNGKRDGTWSFFDKEDHKLSEGSFKDGIESGPWKMWHPNGKPSREGAFLEGKMHGHWKFYFDDGTLESEGDFKNGLHLGIWQFYHFNTQRRSLGSYEEDKRVGKWEFWWNNGELQEVRRYEGDENILDNSWTDNGTPMVVEGTGPYEYWEYGILKEKGAYLDYKMHGEWSFYEDGNLLRTMMFDKGEEVKQ